MVVEYFLANKWHKWDMCKHSQKANCALFERVYSQKQPALERCKKRAAQSNNSAFWGYNWAEYNETISALGHICDGLESMYGEAFCRENGFYDRAY